MTTISAVLACRPGEIHHLASTLASDGDVYADVAAGLKRDVGDQLDGLDGEAIEAAVETTTGVTGYLAAVGDEFVAISRVLTAFATDVDTAQKRITAVSSAAEARGYEVSDDGVIMLPSGPIDPKDLEVAKGWTRELEAALKLASDADRRATEALGGHGPESPRVPGRADNRDPRAALASTSISMVLEPTAQGLRQAEPVDDFAKGVIRAGKIVPVVGNLAGFGIGVAAADDAEPLEETLIAEGSGLAASVAAGAMAGSFIPGAGTLAGAAGGAFIGGIAGFAASGAARELFDATR